MTAPGSHWAMNGIKTRERTRLVERQAKSRLAQLVVAEPKRR